MYSPIPHLKDNFFSLTKDQALSKGANGSIDVLISLQMKDKSKN